MTEAATAGWAPDIPNIPDDADFDTTPDRWVVRHWLHENKLSLHFVLDADEDNDDDWSYSGWIDFQGCFNWQTNPYTYAHACDPEHIDELKRAFITIKGLAARRVKSWCG